MNQRLKEALEDQDTVAYDERHDVYITWNGSQTFQAFRSDGECIAVWMRSYESAGPFSGVNAEDTADALESIARLIDSPYIDDGDGEIHYLAAYAQDQDTYQRYS